MNRYDELKKHIEETAKLAYDLNYAVAADPELSGCEYRACSTVPANGLACRRKFYKSEDGFSSRCNKT